jgi:thiosulfate/3-mercaptopyruvate sulfurtransferase
MTGTAMRAARLLTRVLPVGILTTLAACTSTRTTSSMSTGTTTGTAAARTQSAGTSRPNARAANAVPMLVSTAWLSEHAADRDLVVLHVGNKAQYDSAHVAGSRHVALDEISLPTVQGGLSLQMAGEAQLKQWAERNGIGDRTRIVVVPHDANIQSATRVYFTLAYLGAMDRASLLDGGFLAWKSEKRAISTTAPAAAASTTFTPRLRPELIAYIAQVEQVTKNKSTFLVDARLSNFYNGQGGGYPRPGHIPTAINIPLNTVSATGFIKPQAELKTLFSAAGVDGSKPVITYCHIGQQATVLWFVATLLGLDARMYDGSFQEWSGRADLPLAGPPGAPRDRQQSGAGAARE